MNKAVEDMKKISLKEFELLNTSTPVYPGSKSGQAWTPEKDFEKSLRMRIVKREEMSLEFDLIGVDPSLANALRCEFKNCLLADVFCLQA